MNDICVGIYGLPGKGKTTTLAAIATASLSGRPFLDIPPHCRVFSTVPIPGCFELHPDMIGVYDLSDSLLLIDEATQFFDARHWKDTPKHVLDFFAVHRHERCSVVLFTQTFAGCDSRIRSLCQQHYLLDSLPFGFSVVQPIVHKQAIFNYKPDDRYILSHFWEWAIIPRKRYYQLFDSYCSFFDYKPFTPVLYPGENRLVRASRLRGLARSVWRPKNAPIISRANPLRAIQTKFSALKCIIFRKYNKR